MFGLCGGSSDGLYANYRLQVESRRSKVVKPRLILILGAT